MGVVKYFIKCEKIISNLILSLPHCRTPECSTIYLSCCGGLSPPVSTILSTGSKICILSAVATFSFRFMILHNWPFSRISWLPPSTCFYIRWVPFRLRPASSGLSLLKIPGLGLRYAGRGSERVSFVLDMQGELLKERELASEVEVPARAALEGGTSFILEGALHLGIAAAINLIVVIHFL